MGTSDEIFRLREGAMVDYDRQTWKITSHEAYDDSRWPSDVWTLQNSSDVRFLEHDYDGVDVFRLFKTADIADVTIDGEPFEGIVRDDEESPGAPDAILYQGDEYMLVEEDARLDEPSSIIPEELTRSENDWKLTGICGGIAEYFGLSSSVVRFGFILGTFATNLVFPCLLMPLGIALYAALAFAIPAVDHSTPERTLSHYWVYQMDDQFVVLERGDTEAWDVYAGRRVEPYEFDNILPA